MILRAFRSTRPARAETTRALAATPALAVTTRALRATATPPPRAPPVTWARPATRWVLAAIRWVLAVWPAPWERAAWAGRAAAAWAARLPKHASTKLRA